MKLIKTFYLRMFIRWKMAFADKQQTLNSVMIP